MGQELLEDRYGKEQVQAGVDGFLYVLEVERRNDTVRVELKHELGSGSMTCRATYDMQQVLDEMIPSGLSSDGLSQADLTYDGLLRLYLVSAAVADLVAPRPQSGI